MNELDTLDLCARLDTMKKLCDQLEEAQADERKYRALVERIRAEADALQVSVCAVADVPAKKRPAEA